MTNPVNYTAKVAAVAVSVANIATLSAPVTIDGRSVLANEVVLLTGQTDKTQNGLWTVKAGAWVRPVSFASATEQVGTYVTVSAGTVYINTAWVLETLPATVDTDLLTWGQMQHAVLAPGF